MKSQELPVEPKSPPTAAVAVASFALAVGVLSAACS